MPLRDEPLDIWLWADEMRPLGVGESAFASTGLDAVQRILDRTPAGTRPDYYKEHHWLFATGNRCVALRPGVLRRAERIYRQVMERGGTGGGNLQEALLVLIGYSSDPGSLPFWEELLAVRRARDRFAKDRRTLALAAVALLVIRGREEAAAMEVLRVALSHDEPEARSMAALYLRRAWQRTGATPPKAVLDDLNRLATADGKFEPRFMARRALAELGQPLPLENRGGAYRFKVWHKWHPNVYQVIELASEQTLHGLHAAILTAWDWGDEHLYAFYLNNRRYDPTFEFDHHACDDAPAYAEDVRLGELGLRLRQRLLFLFDFGDNHEFVVQVVGIREEAGDGPFPRFIDSVGDPMPQYPAYG